MALTVAQYEEILGVLQEVPILVDELEARKTAFSDDVLGWLKQSEQVLTNNRLPEASQIAACRGRLIEAGRGVQQRDLTIMGRQSMRKIRQATAALVLGTGTEILHAVIAERKSVFQEAERISRQMLAVAKAKGLVAESNDGEPHQQFLQELREKLTADPDIAGVHAHIVGLVGATDALVLMDRALPSV